MQSKHMCSGTDMSPSVARFEMVFTFNSSRENKISNPTFVLTFFFCNDIVRFLGKTRLHKVFQASSRSWTICRSTNWSLCLCWMDLWVRITFCTCKVSNFTKYLTSVTYKKHLVFSPEVILCGCTNFRVFNWGQTIKFTRLWHY